MDAPVTVTAEAALERAHKLLAAWWFTPVARGRIAVLRTGVYGFIFFDVLINRPWVALRGELPGELYHPLDVARVLHFPAPTPLTVRVVETLLLGGAAVALTGKAPRLAGWLVFITYVQWQFFAFSFGKVDHDRLAFLVALAVLPTAGPARWGDRQADESAGWAVRCIQVAVVLTYFLSVFAKLRFGGIAWINGATLLRAVIRRGAQWTEPLQDHPAILRAGQGAIVAFETLSPLLLAPGMVGRLFVGAAVAFHLITYSAIGIMFWPHVLCLLLAFLPVENLRLPRANRGSA